MSKNKITFLGTGLMGNPMAMQLLNSGYPLAIYNRTESRALNLKEAGAEYFLSPENAIKKGELIISMLTDYKAHKEIICKLEKKSLENKVWIMMSTISPSESIELASLVKTRGGRYAEAPVLGSIPQATDGSLQILFGGKEDLFAECRTILETIGTELYYFGDVGKASAAKLALNQLIVSLTTAFSASLGFVKKSGADSSAFMNLLRSSALYAPTYDKKLSKMENRDFSNPNFPLKHMLKDVGLIIKSFSERDIETGFLEETEKIIRERIEIDGEYDYSALFNGIVPVDK